MVYQTVDTIIVGQVLGNVGISAVTISSDVITFLTIMVMGFSSAAQIIMSQYIGAGKKDKLGEFFGTFITLLAISGVVLTIAGLILRKQLLRWMNTPEEAFEEAVAYITVTMCGLLFVFGFNALSSVIRGLGDSKHPFIFVLITSICNLGLDVLFVVGMNKGSFGAALATVICQAISLILATGFIIIKKDNLGFVISKKDWRVRKEYFLPLVKLGIPMALKSAAVSISKLFTNSYINSYGLIVSAVTGIGTKMVTIASLVSNSLGAAGGSVIGQNIGAEKYDRVKKTVIATFVISVIFSAVVAIILIFFPQQFFMLFTKDVSIMPVAMEYVPILVVLFIANAARSSGNALINGSGNHRLNLLLALLDALVLRIGLSLFFGLVVGMEYRGFWLGSALTTFTPMVVGGIYLLSGKWKTNKYIIK